MSDTDSNQQHRWIAFELHDRLLPWIHGARLQLDGLEVPAESKQRLDIAIHCLQIAAEEGRSLIGFLETTLGECSQEQLSEMAHRFLQQAQMLVTTTEQSIKVDSPLEFPTNLTTAQAWTVLRILQQAVQNAIQHAGPCSIRISTQTTQSDWQLRIQDDGVGFDSSQPATANHFGITSMQQRAASLPGQFQIHSQPCIGTQVCLKVGKV